MKKQITKKVFKGPRKPAMSDSKPTQSHHAQESNTSTSGPSSGNQQMPHQTIVNNMDTTYNHYNQNYHFQINQIENIT